MNKLITAKHPLIEWNHGPLQYAPGEGMTTTIGVFRVEVRLDSDRVASLFVPQVGINGKPISIIMSGLPAGDPVDLEELEELLDRCVGFLQRRLEAALETIGETGEQNQ